MILIELVLPSVGADTSIVPLTCGGKRLVRFIEAKGVAK
jgi:hypothetical protein